MDIEDAGGGNGGRGVALTSPPPRVLVLGGLLVLLMLFLLEAVSERLTWDYFGADPVIYRERMAEIFSGRVPYIDTEFEHLPVMLVPMAAAWLLGGFTGVGTYWLVWAALSVAGLFLTASQLRGLQSEVPGLTGRWFLLAAPLLPLVVFRNDVWVTLLAVIGMVGIAQGRVRRGLVGMVGGALAKGWPIVLAVPLWRRGWRTSTAWATSGSVIALGAISLFPGFGEGRGFAGLHTESLGGSIWGLWEVSTAGRASLLGQAGATYIDAPTWLAIPGLVVGAVLAVLAVRRRPTSTQRDIVGVGALICAILVASPLQSTQFIYWMTPFAAASFRRRTLLLALAASVVASLSLLDFPTLAAGGDAWWFAIAVLRNVFLVALGIRLATESPCGRH